MTDVTDSPNEEMPASAVVPTKEPKTVRMSPAQKAEAIHIWRTGQARNVSELATKYGVKVNYLNSLFQRAKVKKGDLVKKLEAKRDAAVDAAQTAMLDPTIHAQRVFDTKDETYRILVLLRKMVAREVMETRQKGLPIGSSLNNMKAIREAAAAIKTCREEAYAVLGIKVDDAGDETLPELKITGLDDEQIEQLQQQQSEDGLGDLPPPEPADEDDNPEVGGGADE